VRPTHVLVVVPAHQEGDRLAACLDALARATAAATSYAPGLRVRTTVVLDRCSDRSAEVVAGHDVDALPTDAGSVGAARRAGIAHARTVAGPITRPARCWVANTDADSTVPEGWLVEQLDAAAAGADLVLGPVRLDPAEADPVLVAAWTDRHTRPDQHVFGANLGVRLTSYDAAGGFGAHHEHEDVRLVEAVAALGGRMTRSRSAVTTSARRTGRTPGGLAGYLTTLETDLVG